MPGTKKNILIVGAGIAGIASSIRLAVNGHQVRVFEKNETPGGKLTEFSVGPYRFDLGPSLFTLPYLVTELFSLAGKNPSQYFRYKEVELACRYFWEDGTIINAWTDNERFTEEVSKKLKINRKALKNYLTHTSKLLRYTSPVFLEHPLRISAIPVGDMIRAAGYLHEMDLLISMNEANKRRLRNEKLVQIFNRMATYNGSNPYKAPGVLNVISSLEHGNGVFFPLGGMYAVVSSLVSLARDIGVEFHLNEEVKEIIHQRGVAKGINTSTGIHNGDIIISNADVVPTYKNLLRDITPPENILREERSSSALVFYWGIKREFPELDLHNIFFSNNYREEFYHLFDKLELYEDPTIYVNISSKMNPDDAPEGHENWFVMLNAPHNEGQNWKKNAEDARNIILKKLSKILSTDISSFITEESILDPVKIESLSSSWKGSLYGASSNSTLAAFFRHPNHSRKIKGLYFAGGSVHPGGGIPLCLLSAKITAELIDKVS